VEFFGNTFLVDMLDNLKIRNFCIIAHIDHGKSTLADRFLQMTETLSERDMTHGQMLDTMELEQERGITIKLQPVKMLWKGISFNLIDTPGHVDFSYEVSRSLAACEGAILVVDSTQGIQAQTLATVYAAIDHNLAIIPVINKIDLPNAEPDKVKHEIMTAFGFREDEIICCSAKTGIGIEEILDSIIKTVPAPSLGGSETKALIFDAVYDSYRGVVAYIRIMEGGFKKGDKIYLVGASAYGEVLDIGYFTPAYKSTEKLECGDIGYIVSGQKDLKTVRVGDTITKVLENQAEKKIQPLSGYRKVLPVVFAGIFCTDNSDYDLLRKALEKLCINDSSLSFDPKHSEALGFGFHCGFLGLLHLEIVQERLEREYDLDLIVTAPSVSYIVTLKDGIEKTISNPSELPDPGSFDTIKQPWVRAEIVVPTDYVGSVMKLCEDRYGIYLKMDYIDSTRVVVHYELPLFSIVMEFYDQLKSGTSGYASFSYEIIEYRVGDLVKMDILVASEIVDSLATIVPRKDAHSMGTSICKRLKEIIPKHMFRVSLQAAIGGKIVAREDISAMSKDVTAKLYGGDVTRKNKLRKKQAKGKKRMKQFGRVQIPQQAFLSLLKKD
jgi:GTP-binding protein LepA